jgi:uncharacterized cupin superfamily protein
VLGRSITHHDTFEEPIYGLDGVSTWTVDGQVHEIGAGDALCIPRGVVHGFDNRGTQDAKFLAISSPGLMQPDYFREVGRRTRRKRRKRARPWQDRRGYAPLRTHPSSAPDAEL